MSDEEESVYIRNAERDRVLKARDESYRKFLIEESKRVETKWEEFSDNEDADNKKPKKGAAVQKTNGKKRKVSETGEGEAVVANGDVEKPVPVKGPKFKAAKKEVVPIVPKKVLTKKKNTPPVVAVAPDTESEMEEDQDDDMVDDLDGDDIDGESEDLGEEEGNSDVAEEQSDSDLDDEEMDGEEMEEEEDEEGDEEENSGDENESLDTTEESVEEEEPVTVQAKPTKDKFKAVKEVKRLQKNTPIKTKGDKKDDDYIVGDITDETPTKAQLSVLRAKAMANKVDHLKKKKIQPKEKSGKNGDAPKQTYMTMAEGNSALLCLGCRESGHRLKNCPKFKTQVCIKCGSADHKYKECKTGGGDFKFATCFVCKEVVSTNIVTF